MPDKIKCRCWYRYEIQFGNPRHLWACIGPRGCVHLYVVDMGEKSDYDRYSGGFEIHHRQPPEYMKNEAPSHDECFFLKQPCWHDGSTLYATETLIPYWQIDPNDHDRMFACLEREYVKRFHEGGGTPTTLETLASVEPSHV